MHWTHGSGMRHLPSFTPLPNQEGAQAKTATEDSCAIQTRGELAQLCNFSSSALDEAVKKDLAERVSRVAQLEAALVPWHTASCTICNMSSPLNSKWHSMPFNH